jgi:hypothetical protein
MGILFVLLFLGAAGLVLAAVGTLFLGGFFKWFTRNADNDVQGPVRQKIIRNAMLFPVGCLAWAALVFIFQGFVNSEHLHRDIGLGDSFYCPLPNGYSLLMIDVEDQGEVFNPKTQGEFGETGDQSDAVLGVTQLQISGPDIFGVRDSQWSGNLGQRASVNRYFLLDTRGGRHIDLDSEGALQAEASKRGVSLKLEPISTVYRRYRYTWFDAVAGVLLIAPILLVAVYLFLSAMRLRASKILPSS